MLPLRSLGTAFAICAISAAGPSVGAMLDFLEAETNPSLSGVSAVTVSPDGLHLYAVSSTTNSLIVLARDSGTGLLSFVEAEVDGTGGVAGMLQPKSVAVSPDGNHVYVISRADDAIALFSRDPGTGSVTFVEAVFNETNRIEGIWQAAGLAVDPLGEYVLGSGRKSPPRPRGAVSLFNRDSSTGVLTIADFLYDTLMGTTGLGKGASLAVSPDGAHIYAASATANSVVVFELDRAGGALAFVETELQGVNGVSGLTGAADLVVSPDGAFVYVAAATDNAVTTFSRDAQTGALDLVDMVSGLVGLSGASGITISPTGEVLLVSGAADNSIAFFSRDIASGQIFWSEAQTDGVAGVDGLAGASDVAMSPDGTNIYVCSPGDRAVAVFGRGIALDFGDAPDPTFPTLLASDGARHVIVPGLFLASGIDAETDGQPSAGADGDDLAGIDDESGITFATPLIPGQPASVDVSASAAGALDAWIDFNGDGDWDDAGDQIAASVPLAAGTTNVAFAVPPTALPQTAVAARFRFRASGDPSTAPNGLAPSGEVEDYLASIGTGADLGVVAVADTPTADWLQPFTITVTVTNGGPNVVVGASVDVLISADATGVTWTCVATNGTCAAAGVADISDLVDLLAGGSLVYTIDGSVIDLAPGPSVSASATVAPPPGVTDPVASNDAGIANVVIPSIFIDGFESGDTSAWSATVP